MWVKKPGGIVVGVRQPNWLGNTTAVGEPMPPGTMGAMRLENGSRSGQLWLYDPDHGDFILDFKYDQFTFEPGTKERLFQGRFNPVGQATLFLHGRMVKFIVGGWQGEDPGRVEPTLLRAYTNVWWE